MSADAAAADDDDDYDYDALPRLHEWQRRVSPLQQLFRKNRAIAVTIVMAVVLVIGISIYSVFIASPKTTGLKLAASSPSPVMSPSQE